MIKTILAAGASAILGGCGVLQGSAGETAYTLEPMKGDDGAFVCCRVDVKNTKNYDKFKFKLVKQPDGGVSVELSEDGVNASDPARVQAENNGKLLDAVGKLLPGAGG